MKQIILSITLVVIVTICQAQVPQAFSFQSLVLDVSSDPISDQDIGVLIQILDGSPIGTVLYSENHTPTTNGNGLYSIDIGNGNVISGSFETIDWLSGAKFIALSHDTDGGTDYTLVGSSQLLSVPYALAAGTSFIAPKIYANSSTLVAELDVARTDPTELFSYFYDWIQGDPEDVFVEYSNLPDNVNIQRRTQNGFFDNPTSVDTIIDGFIRPNSYFGVVDPSVDLTLGSYEVDATFRTSTEVLAEIKIPLDIINSTVEEVNCAEDYEGELVVVSICDELDNLIGTEIQIQRIDNKNIIVSNFLDTNTDLELTFTDDECVPLRVNNSIALSLGQYTLQDLDAMTNNGSIEFRMELIDQDGEDIGCEVIYGQ
jgi:hypothetical protein